MTVCKCVGGSASYSADSRAEVGRTNFNIKSGKARVRIATGEAVAGVDWVGGSSYIVLLVYDVQCTLMLLSPGIGLLAIALYLSFRQLSTYSCTALRDMFPAPATEYPPDTRCPGVLCDFSGSRHRPL